MNNEAGICLDPLVSDALLKRLEVAFPCNFDRSMTHREMDHTIGHQEVRDYLRRLHAEERA